MDPNKAEIVDLLTSAVTLYDQIVIPSEQDTRYKREIAKMLHRLTSPIIKNPLTVKELLSMILDKLKVQKLLHLRLVCRHWKSAIEAICAQKQYLKLYSFVIQNQNIALSNRFFGALKLEQFVELKLKYLKETAYSFHNPLEEDFCSFLGKTFPRVDHLIVKLDLNSNSASNLYNMMQKYLPNLNTLSLSTRSSELSAFCINKLKRLDLSETTNVQPNAELMAQLEHFSGKFISNEKNVPYRMPQLGPNCTSFWWSFNYSGEAHVPFDEWIQLNSAQVLANITHLGLFNVDKPVIGIICENFLALKVLEVRCFKSKSFSSNTCVDLAKLTHLTTLSVGRVLFDLDSLESPDLTTKMRLPSIQVLNLMQCGVNRMSYTQFDGDRFCRVFAYVFPNIRKLGTRSCFDEVDNTIRDNLKHFGEHLKFKILSPDYYL